MMTKYNIDSQNWRKNTIAICGAFLFRPAMLLYRLALMNKLGKNLIISSLLLAAAVNYMFPSFIDMLLNGGVNDMTFQDYDRVPNWNEFGMLGDLIRAIVWPIIVLSGLFFILSPTPLFFPIVIGLMVLNVWMWKMKYKPSIAIYYVLFIFAFLVPGFTSYIRYIYPLIVITPLLVPIRRVKYQR